MKPEQEQILIILADIQAKKNAIKREHKQIDLLNIQFKGDPNLSQKFQTIIKPICININTLEAEIAVLEAQLELL